MRNFKHWAKSLFFFPLLLIFSSFLFVSNSASSMAEEAVPNTDLYNLADLEILVTEKNYSEFFRHARDIRPSQRNQYWKNMVGQMAENYTKEVLAKKDINQKTLHFINSLFEWPQVKESDLYLQNRGQIGIYFYENCFKKESKNDPAKTHLKNCFNEMVQFWKIHHHDPYLGVDLAKMAQKYYQPTNLLDWWPLISKATNFEFSHFLCQEAQVKNILFHYLNKVLLDFDYQTPKIKEFLDKNLAEDCWKAFKGDLEQLLLHSEGEFQKSAFYLLKIKSSLTLAHQDFYLTLFVLEGPVRGELFNLSWNNLAELGKKQLRREKALELLINIDPLPGKIFNSFDEKKKTIILDYFHKNFPEYMDYYASTCLDYLSGKRTFKKGNPTIFCSQLFQSAQSTQWIGPQLLIDYKNIKKF